MSEVKIKPQAGKQTDFLSTSVDIAIYGGEAGGGKTAALLIEPLRHIRNPKFNGVIFRRTYADVAQQGGIWDETYNFYPYCNAKPNMSELTWTFPKLDKYSRDKGAVIGFAHLQHEKDKLSYQGAQIPFIAFDELTHFTESQFWYLVSRNRTGSCENIKPYIRATCNPDPDSFVKKLILPYLDAEGEYANPDMSGKILYLIRNDDEIIFATTEQELKEKYPKYFYNEAVRATSFTFIPATLDDNLILLQKDPNYRSRLMSLPLVDRMRLLGGNWKIKESAGLLFKKEWFKVVYNLYMPNFVEVIRYWDRAATEKNIAKKSHDPDYTVGALLGRAKENNRIVILDIVRFRGRPAEVKERIKQTAIQDKEDYKNIYSIGLEQEPGASGQFETDDYIRSLQGFYVKIFPARQDKITRSKPLSSQCENGNVSILQGLWNDVLLNELEAFPDGLHDDQVDACSGAFSAIAVNKGSNMKDIKIAGKIDYDTRKSDYR